MASSRTDPLAQCISRLLNTFPEFPTSFLLALSGGLDSMVLLHALHRYLPASATLRAVHVHHGLQDAADHWAAFCSAQCSELNLPFECLHVKVEADSGNLEALARAARYQALSDHMSPGEILLTAHHQDDQAETFLLQLMRGSGIEGLAAMPFSRTFAAGSHARPLLAISRETLLQYARRWQLDWRDDPTNLNTEFDRNFLRHQVIPLLSQRWPSAGKTISRAAENCQDALESLQPLFRADLSACLGAYQHSLSASRLLQLPPVRQRNVLREWIRQNQVALADRHKIETLRHWARMIRHDAMPLLSWDNVEIRRFDGFFYLMETLPEAVQDRDIELHEATTHEIQLPYPAGRLVIDIPPHNHLLFPIGFQVRFRRTGQQVRLNNRQGRRSVKKLFQEWRIPPWIRDYVPLLYRGDECIALAGYALAESELADKISLSWQPPENLSWQANLPED